MLASAVPGNRPCRPEEQAEQLRIALTHAYSWPEVRRGAERIIYELSRALAAGGHTVTVYTAGRHPGVQRTGGVTTVRLRQLAPAGARHEMLFGLALVPRLAKARFDAVHALGPRDAVAAIRAARLGRCGRSVCRR
jgi:glycosyltransferase involved in cell wall biosynthesis